MTVRDGVLLHFARVQGASGRRNLPGHRGLVRIRWTVWRRWPARSTSANPPRGVLGPAWEGGHRTHGLHSLAEPDLNPRPLAVCMVSPRQKIPIHQELIFLNPILSITFFAH